MTVTAIVKIVFVNNLIPEKEKEKKRRDLEGKKKCLEVNTKST